MSPVMLLVVGGVVWFLVSAWQGRQDDEVHDVPQSPPQADGMRARLDAVAVLSSCCHTDDDKAALQKIVACVLNHKEPTDAEEAA